ncbi:MAG: PDZ domain-containing protein [Alcanivoracaceae bacterium]|nr:PDZ domain-containing protein [Alcanivoracaceae bacterium]
MKNFFLTILVYFFLLVSNRVYSDSTETQAYYAGLFDEVCKIVEENFYDPAKIEDEFPPIKKKYTKDLIDIDNSIEFSVIINKMLEQLKTSHTYYLTPADYEYYHLSAIFSAIPVISTLFKDEEIIYPSIGVITEKIAGKVFIVSVLSGSVAQEAGLLRGDEVISVNGKPFTAIKSIESSLGKSVEFKIKRSHQEGFQLFSVVPIAINPKKEMLEAEKSRIKIIEQDGKKIGYIHIYSYAGIEYHQELLAAITWGELKDADALIIDLRYGLGGANTSYLNLFNSNIPILETIDRTGKKQRFDSQWRKPAVYLVNKTTRSGKELLAFGAKKYKFATVVGETTAGAATAGRLFPLSNGDLIYLAVMGVKIDGVKLEGIGVAPDIFVPEDVRYSMGKDIQLEKSVSYLVERLQKN